MRSTLILTLLGAMWLGACATTATPAMEPQLSPTLGEATRSNIAAMAIVPTQAERDNTFIPFDRKRRAKAIEDYREGETASPEVMSTRGN